MVMDKKEEREVFVELGRLGKSVEDMTKNNDQFSSRIASAVQGLVVKFDNLKCIEYSTDIKWIKGSNYLLWVGFLTAVGLIIRYWPK